jgi:hypothetical protein
MSTIGVFIKFQEPILDYLDLSELTTSGEVLKKDVDFSNYIEEYANAPSYLAKAANLPGYIAEVHSEISAFSSKVSRMNYSDLCKVKNVEKVLYYMLLVNEIEQYLNITGNLENISKSTISGFEKRAKISAQSTAGQYKEIFEQMASYYSVNSEVLRETLKSYKEILSQSSSNLSHYWTIANNKSHK